MRRSCAALSAVAALSLAPLAEAQEVGRFAVRGELGLGAALSSRQRDALGYDFGAVGALRVGARVAGPFWLQLGAGHWLLPAPQGTGYATPLELGPRFAWDVGARGRFWFDVNPGVVITGGDARFGVSAGLGYSVRAGRVFELGPMLRYQAVLTSGSDLPGDAHLAMVGISVGLQPTPPPPPTPAAPAPEAPPPQPVPRDRDHDGAIDEDDRCPDEPAGSTPDATRSGCPAGDRDGDGVLDPNDRCPDEPAGPTPDATRSGCPAGDRDGDGVLDPNDRCPDEPAGPAPDAARPGCAAPDRDGDTVPDATDACPDRPGAPSANPRQNGCPGLVVVQGGLIRINRPVFFATNADTILPRSNAVLEAVAQTLTLSPQIRRVRVEGHTDNQGAAAANLDLSRRRAESVARWLTEHGVAAPRLEAQGLGPQRPVRSNLTRGGRAANRRVEFHILDPAPARTSPERATQRPATSRRRR